MKHGKKSKQELIKATLIAFILSGIISIVLYTGLKPMMDMLPILLASLTISILITSLSVYKYCISPLQRHLEKLSQKITVNSSQCSDKTATQSNLSEKNHLVVIEEKIDSFYEIASTLIERGGQIAIASAEVSFTADKLSGKVHNEVEDVKEIAESADRISSIVSDVNKNAAMAASLASQTRDTSDKGQKALRSAIKQMQQTNDQANDASQTIANLETKSEQIQHITSVISGIAEQTNLLALNAAIEAARAGEQGRGFAVVADEVRALAGKTAEATNEIGSMVSEIGRDVQQAVNTMSSLADAINEGTSRTEKVGEQLDNIISHSENMQEHVGSIARGAESNYEEVNQITTAINSVSGHLSETETGIGGISEQAQKLSQMSEDIHAMLMSFNPGSFHNQMRSIAAEAASQVEHAFEHAISDKELTINDIFDRDYQPIKDTNPQKYSTQFDGFTDKTFPSIQEPLLESSNHVAYAGAVDNNGYFPTHNKRFSQPLTGNYETDLLSNRTKRIFNDPTGARCGSNTSSFLLQTYKRDTGEVMHDLSIPISVNGRHWGGFRIGYKAEA